MEGTLIWKLFKNLEKHEADAFERWLSMDSKKTEPHTWFIKKLESKPTRDQLKQKLIDSPLFSEVVNGELAENELIKLSREVKSHLSQYLAFLRLKKDKNRMSIMLMEEIQERAEPEIFDTFWKHTFKGLTNKKNPRSAETIRAEYELEIISHEYLREKQKDKRFHKLNNINRAFDLWWAYEKFILLLANATRNSFQNFDTQSKKDGEKKSPDSAIKENEILKKECLAILENEFQKFPLILEVILTLNQKKTSTSRYAELLTTFTQSSEVVNAYGADLLKNIFNYLHNFFVKKVHQEGNKKVFEEFTELFLWGLEHKILFNQKHLLLTHYDNILAVCRQAERLSEAFQLSKKLKSSLPRYIRKEAYRFNYGQCLFYNDEFIAAKEELSKKEFKRVHYNIQSKFTLLQIEFELLEQTQNSVVKNDDIKENLIVQSTNLYEFIRSQNGLTATYKKTSMNRARLCKKLFSSYYANEFRALRQEVLELNTFSSRKWLLEKIDQKLI